MKNIIFITLYICVSICLVSCAGQNWNSYSNYEIERLSDCIITYGITSVKSKLSGIYNYPDFLDKYAPQDEFYAKFITYMVHSDMQINKLPPYMALNHTLSIFGKKVDKSDQKFKNIIQSNITDSEKSKEFTYIMDNAILHCIKDYNNVQKFNVKASDSLNKIYNTIKK